MAAELTRTLREVRDRLLAEPVSPRVADARDINLHYCQYVARTVAERVGDDVAVEILEDGGGGYGHTWLRCDRRHYDAECVEGVTDHRDLPFFRRHPEAAVGVESGATTLSSLRHRGERPLYPVGVGSQGSTPGGIDRRAYRRLVLVSVLFGVALFLIGATSEWALRHGILGLPPSFGVLFHDAWLLGEVVVLVSPFVFFLLLPTSRASP
ncbi:hypothetical protein N0B31_10155 [Salinirubellus salinus]|uniref:Uncharacterized protein n=1 Tax=Salinirubellus salinus TaxID=1364945 RepID=A0A9E7R6R9_9EURY|nr:hypothetical protein [Salinirubellus salinus]UWM56637.1 hypothetical protein N0B31_10155 [Salinirubellus salinus]